MQDFKNIWQLLKSGKLETTNRTASQWFLFLFKMLVILFLFKLISLGLIFILDYYTAFDKPETLTRESLYGLDELQILFVVAVFAPIMEELTFRLLLKISRLNLTIGVAAMTFSFCRLVIQTTYLNAGVFTMLVVVFTLLVSDNQIGKLSGLWKRKHIYVFYALLLLFTTLHLFNYKITTGVLWFAPIILLPRFLGGLVYSYARLSSGIVMAICLHTINNGMLPLIRLFLN